MVYSTAYTVLLVRSSSQSSYLRSSLANLYNRASSIAIFHFKQSVKAIGKLTIPTEGGECVDIDGILSSYIS